MNTSRWVVVAAVLAAVGVTVVAPVAALAPVGPVPQAGDNGTADDGPAEDTADNRTVNGSFGTQVASFMQASAASTDSSVESGVWQASVNRSAQPGRAVESRAAALEDRLDRLQNRSARLAAARERGGIPEVAYTARASAVRAQLDAVRTAISEANETAQQAGVNTARLDRLRDRAANLTGPEVAALARNITDVGRGPPPGVGPPEDGTRGPPNNGTGGPAGEGGPDSPGNATGSGNGADDPGSDGPPDDRSGGQGNDQDSDQDKGNAGNSGGSGDSNDSGGAGSGSSDSPGNSGGPGDG